MEGFSHTLETFLMAFIFSTNCTNMKIPLGKKDVSKLNELELYNPPLEAKKS